MRAGQAFALGRASARVVLGVGVGGLVLVVYRAVSPVRMRIAAVGISGFGMDDFFRILGSSPWDRAVAALGVVIAVVVAAAVYRPGVRLIASGQGSPSGKTPA